MTSTLKLNVWDYLDLKADSTIEKLSWLEVHVFKKIFFICQLYLNKLKKIGNSLC